MAPRPLRPLLLLSFASFTALSTCGPVSLRELSAVPQRRITYDDMCHLQSYFDQRAESPRPPWRALDEQSTETSRSEPDERGRMQVLMIGDGNYLLNDSLGRRRLAQLLHEEYRDVPTDFSVEAGQNVQVHAYWWASGLARRLRPDQNITLTTQGRSIEVPFNPCMGEFLFGTPLYAMRRQYLEEESVRARGQVPTARANTGGDGGFVGASVSPPPVPVPAAAPPPAAPPPAAPPAPAAPPPPPPPSGAALSPSPYH